ncbi:hypothetical protein F4X73_10170 [Candidatus Poribacteria bacterium]|nr:hypothetical protein [Candidatus Poribacteria bacterium]
MQENEISVPENHQHTETHTLQAMSFSEILDGMFSLYRKHFPLFFRIVIVYFILRYTLDKITQLFLFESLSDGDPAALFITTVITYLIAILVSGALSYASAEVLFGRTITTNAAYQHTLSKYFPLLVAFIIYVLVCTGLAITCIGIPFFIFFLVRWSVYTLPILIEGHSTMGALRRSAELVRNSWWRVCGIILAILIIFLMIQSILINSFGIVFFLLTGTNETEMFGIIRQMFLPTPLDIGWGLYLIRSFVTIAIEAITTPISVIGYTLLYFDLRVRKEAYDLEMQATQQQEQKV